MGSLRLREVVQSKPKSLPSIVVCNVVSSCGCEVTSCGAGLGPVLDAGCWGSLHDKAIPVLGEQGESLGEGLPNGAQGSPGSGGPFKLLLSQHQGTRTRTGAGKGSHMYS